MSGLPRNNGGSFFAFTWFLKFNIQIEKVSTGDSVFTILNIRGTVKQFGCESFRINQLNHTGSYYRRGFIEAIENLSVPEQLGRCDHLIVAIGHDDKNIICIERDVFR